MISPFSISRLGVGLGPSYLSAIGFKGTGAPTQDGRSGYWRLFYYQLQEAELEKEKQKREQEQRQKAPEGKSEAASQTAPAKPSRAKPRVKSSSTQTQAEIPVFIPKKLYLVPKRQEQIDVAPLLRSVSSDLTTWALHSQELSVKFAVVEKKKAIEQAANDDEDETIMWLLLAA